MPKIDSQMLQIYQSCTQAKSEGGGQISQDGALLLIKRAEEINSTTSSCYKAGDSRKGNKYLMTLMSNHKADFSLESLRTLRQYIETGHVQQSGYAVGRPGMADRPDLNVHLHNHDIEVRPGSPAPSAGGRPDMNYRGAPSMPGAGGRPDMARPSNPGMPSAGGRPDMAYPSNPGMPSAGGRPDMAYPSNPGMPGAGGRPDMARPSNPGMPGAGGRPDMARPSNPGMPGAGGRPDMARPSNPGMPGAGGRPDMAHPSNPAMPGAGGRPDMAHPSNPAMPGAGGRPDVARPNNPAMPGAGGRPDEANPNAPARPDPSVGIPSGSVDGPRGREVLNFNANKKTWHCHWFPMQERRPRDNINNLYAENGCLDKLDKLNGGQARDYEYANNRKGSEAGSEFSWWGHCNNASEAACILKEPRQNVTMTGANGEKVVFTPNDIQGLLVKVTSSLINKVDFRGNRFNQAERDNPNDPAPEVFLSVLQDWAKDGLPFVLDIDPGEQVWNYPYDQARIFESTKAPVGFNAPAVSGDGEILYYHTEMSGTGFDQQKRVYEFYIQRNASGEVVNSSWIKTPNDDKNPDFMWRPHPIGDLTNKANWQLRGKPTNPNVDPQLVYDIYMKSII